MKSLTIMEPYASAIAFGMKEYETRPRKTNHRGLLAIHAGKTFSKTGIPNVSWGNHIRVPLTRRYSGVSENDFHKGVILAVVELTDCILMDQSLIDSMSDQERSLGHWEPNRYAYKLENVQILKNPVEARGKQGFWEWEPTDGDLDGITLPETV